VINTISGKHPILLLNTDGHIEVENDLALALAGVDEKTFIRGGCFDKYEDGTHQWCHSRSISGMV